MSFSARRPHGRAHVGQVGQVGRVGPDLPPVDARFRATSGAIPRYVRYVDETADAYLVIDLRSGERHEVDKDRAPVPALSDGPERARHGAGLLRWSGWAVLCALLGGVGGVLLGVPVVLVALLRRAALLRRMRRWRRRHPGEALPAAAREEYDRMRAALWQGMLALLLGALLVGLLISHVW
jgi:hypothetical protein